MQEYLLKDMVIEKIHGIEDVDYLEALNKILDAGPSSGRIYHTNEKQKESIKISQQQIAAGDYISDDELNAEEDEWLNS